jgi:ribosomal peptide maturation radical SAM protein 1
MPFAPSAFPALGLSLLKPILVDAGFSTTVHYATLRFAGRIGRHAYDAVANADARLLAGDWAFAHTLDPQREDEPFPSADFVAACAPGLNGHLALARSQALSFLEEIVAEIAASEPDIVGFTNTFAQGVASLAAARLLKERLPSAVVMMGGANCEGPMGRELVRNFPFVDVVVAGEGESVLLELVSRIVAGSALEGLHGVVTSANARPSDEPAPGRFDSALPVDLDTLPFPDFGEYFAGIAAFAGEEAIAPHLLIEGARGCWWGAKHHCTFCGLNGATLAFRSKSPGRFVSELRHLREAYGVEHVSAVDNIMDYKYYETVLPELARLRLGTKLFFEIKANVRKDQVALLAESGVYEVQPGIESFDNGVLRLMRKGVTMLQNVQLLKWCKEYGVGVAWNILYGFPGEDPGAYERMTALVPLLAHLPPPQAVAPIRVDRFSPYFDDPEALGMTGIRPAFAYARVYDLQPETLANLAYYFDFDYIDGRDPEAYVGPLVAAVAAWQTKCLDVELTVLDLGTSSLLIDRRPGARTPAVILSGPERDVYSECDRIRTPAEIVETTRLTNAALTLDAAEKICASFVAAGLMIEDDGRYLALAVSPRFGAIGPASRERLANAASAF